jgi:hypothetical protein
MTSRGRTTPTGREVSATHPIASAKAKSREKLENAATLEEADGKVESSVARAVRWYQKRHESTTRKAGAKQKTALHRSDDRLIMDNIQTFNFKYRLRSI